MREGKGHQNTLPRRTGGRITRIRRSSAKKSARDPVSEQRKGERPCQRTPPWSRTMMALPLGKVHFQTRPVEGFFFKRSIWKKRQFRNVLRTWAKVLFGRLEMSREGLVVREHGVEPST
jgi:hypothetical protein